jgi:hypothetical protein
VISNLLNFGNRFVDRDMYMRYAGGGVGHYKVTPSDTPANANQTLQEDFAMDDDIGPSRSIFTTTNLERAGREDVREAEHILDDNIDDPHSDRESEEEDEENLDEDDLGAEDGEGGYLDAEDEEGYAAL